MTAVRAEMIKLGSTRTSAGLAGALAGIISLAAVVHILGFDTEFIDEVSEQRDVILDIGVSLGFVFAAISGSLSITTEFRYGTIRPTLLKQPRRTEHLRAKALTQLAVGTALGACAAAYALALTTLFLRFRGLELEFEPDQTARLVAGAGIGGAAFAILGLSVGTMAKTQVPVVVGLLIWMLFIENLLRPGLPAIAKFAPVTLGRTVAGPGPVTLALPTTAILLLSAMSASALVLALRVMNRRDIT